MVETVAEFLARQQLEEEAFTNALFAPALVAKHDSIVARTQQGAEDIVDLFKQDRNAEAFALWNAGHWERNA